MSPPNLNMYSFMNAEHVFAVMTFRLYQNKLLQNVTFEMHVEYVGNDLQNML